MPEINVNDLTLGQLKELHAVFSSSSIPEKTSYAEQPYIIGGMYQLRTVTHIVTGRLLAVGKQELVITEAAWIADTGRYGAAVASGEYEDVEIYPPEQRVIVGRAAMIDAVQIPKLPSVTK